MVGTWQGASAAENDSNSRKFLVDSVTSPMAPVQHNFYIMAMICIVRFHFHHFVLQVF